MEHEPQLRIMDFHQLSQYHMKLAYIMRNHNQFKTCLVLCNWALTSMIRALYIHQNKTNASYKTSLIELLLLLHTDFNPGLDIVVFVGKMQYLAFLEESDELIMKPNNMERLLQRTDSVLCNLSKQIMANPAEQYKSIFGEELGNSITK